MTGLIDPGHTLSATPVRVVVDLLALAEDEFLALPGGVADAARRSSPACASLNS